MRCQRVAVGNKKADGLGLAGSSTSFVAGAVASDPAPIAGTMSNGGRPTVLPAASQRLLERYGLSGAASLLAVHEGRLFHRIARGSRGTCYAVGDTAGVGLATCTRSFPSRAEPVLDMSIYDIAKTNATPIAYPYRVQRFAVDGVSAIGLVAPDGSVSTRVPVSANTYFLATPPSEPVAGIVALNGAGRSVFSRSYIKTAP